MKHPDETLVTPLYVKSDAEMPWPADERAFYVLGSNGLLLCRNHPFFRSSVPARYWPSELARQERFLRLAHPKLPREQIESIVGFFARVGALHRAEAAVLLLWDRETQTMSFGVPEQRATVSQSYNGTRYPVDVHYEIPTLGPNVSVVGDIHSHVDGAAYASYTDKHDESFRAGLHIVVGRVFREPPEFHCEFVVDGARFPVGVDEVIEGYVRRREAVPREWLDKVRVEVENPYSERYGGDWPQARSEH